MKKTLLTIVALLTWMAAGAQTLNVSVGSVTDGYPATQTGEMTFSGGTQMTILNKTYTLSDITRMWTDDTQVTDYQVNVVYSGSEASVYVAGNVAQYLTVSVSGAHVSIVQSSSVADEITYVLSGSSTDGEFYTEGKYKATIELQGLTLTNATPIYSGAAIGIKNGKRIKMSIKKGTENTLADAASSTLDQKAALYVKGHLELQGKGTLSVYGNYAHAIKAGEYIEMKNCTVNVLKSVKDGISCNQYFLMESGTLNVSGVGDDGIQCDIDTDSEATAEIDGHEDENTGNIYLQGGTLSVSATATTAKGIKAEGDIRISGDETAITVTTSGNGTWDTDDKETKAAACMSCDGKLTISGGSVTLTSSGSGGKGAKADGNITISGGAVTVKTTGGLYYNNGSTENKNYTGDTERISNAYYSSPKGIKSGVSGSTTTDLTITGGTISVTTAGRNGEGIESKGTMNIEGGEITVNAYDDAINSGSNMTVSGGYVYARATNNDGLDANGNMYIKGGLVYAVSSGSPEVALDANTEKGYKLYVQGGTIIAIGGLESGSSLSQSCYQTSQWSKNTWYALTYGSTTIAFKTPSSGGSSMVVSAASTPSLKSGVTASGTSIFEGVAYTDATVSGGNSVNLSSYTGGNNGGGPGGGGGRW